jgi:predicted RecA/RadA family phage recombinase
MKNFIQNGKVFEYTVGNSETVASGDVIVKGDLVGVAATGSSTEGAVIACNRCGVYEVAKTASQAYTQGQNLFWDAAEKKVTSTGAGNKPIGKAWAAAASDDTTAQILLSETQKQAANVSFSAGSNLVGVDGAGSNAAPLAGTETRLDALDTGLAAVITALKNAGLMLNA